MKTKKQKSLRRKLKYFSQKSGEDQKKDLHRNLGLYSAGICRVYPCWLALFGLIIQRSNLDGGKLTLDEGTRPPASPLQFKFWLQYSTLQISAVSHSSTFQEQTTFNVI